ncbi:uncharacterized protein BDCG_00730 [Blastomyces dermatitidis ER-3]|uniref:Uncharacterized protein n=1 Tax=Ajellomyces dermatitidis (strain ER-3 / ATCC MYA-2586) TaxID=559297 RepID=A0ABP2EL31_AJEDR|nr:uncharacterized protein BDCG_00730 [Blastomyces dermatitidis ER-3]EEQ83925.2 hypothetical protein BDCG_00730 [Blastomyces dermatitidis ER-3]
MKTKTGKRMKKDEEEEEEQEEEEEPRQDSSCIQVSKSINTTKEDILTKPPTQRSVLSFFIFYLLPPTADYYGLGMNPHQLLRSREVGAGQHQQTSHYHIHQSGSAAEFGISIRDTIRLIERLATSPRFSGPTASNLQEKAFRFLPASPVQY